MSKRISYRAPVVAQVNGEFRPDSCWYLRIVLLFVVVRPWTLARYYLGGKHRCQARAAFPRMTPHPAQLPGLHYRSPYHQTGEHEA